MGRGLLGGAGRGTVADDRRGLQDGRDPRPQVGTEGSRDPLFIDADACPVTRDAIAVARAAHVPVVLVGNETQNLARLADRPGVEAVQMGVGRDAADFAIVERLAPHDVVVTGDIGLAAMVLGRGARAIGLRGREFTLATIDSELALRHAEQRHRRSGGRTKGGPPPFTDEDREHFSAVLRRALHVHPAE